MDPIRHVEVSTDSFADYWRYGENGETSIGIEGVVSVRRPLNQSTDRADQKTVRLLSAVESEAETKSVEESFNAPPPRLWKERLGFNNATCPGLFPGPGRFELSVFSKAFVVCAILESVFLLAICTSTIFSSSTNNHAYLYAILADICTLSFLYYAIDSIYTENAFQLFYTLVISLLLTSFVVFSIFSADDDTQLGPIWKKTRVGVLVVKILCQLVYLSLAWPVWQSFGYVLFRVVSASMEMQRLFKVFLAFFSLMKFDVLVTVLVLFMINANSLKTAVNMPLAIAMVVISVFWAVLGWYAVTRERPVLLVPFSLLAVLKFGYIAFQFYTLWEHPQRITVSVSYTQFAVIGSLSLFVRSLVMWYSWRVYQGFGKGLLKVFGASHLSQATPSRMSIFTTINRTNS